MGFGATHTTATYTTSTMICWQYIEHVSGDVQMECEAVMEALLKGESPWESLLLVDLWEELPELRKWAKQENVKQLALNEIAQCIAHVQSGQALWLEVMAAAETGSAPITPVPEGIQEAPGQNPEDTRQGTGSTAQQRQTILEQVNPDAWRELTQEAERIVNERIVIDGCEYPRTSPHEANRLIHAAYRQALHNLNAEQQEEVGRISRERSALWPYRIDRNAPFAYHQDWDGSIPLLNLAGLRDWLREHFERVPRSRPGHPRNEAQELWHFAREGYYWLEHFTGRPYALPCEPKTAAEAEREISCLRVLVQSLIDAEDPADSPAVDVKATGGIAAENGAAEPDSGKKQTGYRMKGTIQEADLKALFFDIWANAADIRAKKKTLISLAEKYRDTKKAAEHMLRMVREKFQPGDWPTPRKGKSKPPTG